jgi:hypothetical protein
MAVNIFNNLPYVIPSEPHTGSNKNEQPVGQISAIVSGSLANPFTPTI